MEIIEAEGRPLLVREEHEREQINKQVHILKKKIFIIIFQNIVLD